MCYSRWQVIIAIFLSVGILVPDCSRGSDADQAAVKSLTQSANTPTRASLKDSCLRSMVVGAPKLLERFDKHTGRCMSPGYTGPGKGWATRSQELIYPLAVLWATQHKDNPYYQSEELLEVIQKGGDALMDVQHPDGRMDYIAADGSFYGLTYYCWPIYHWLETYVLIGEQLGEERRVRWARGLALAYDGIARQEMILVNKGYRPINTIVWQGMSLARAGQVFGREDWSETGRNIVHYIISHQSEYGYWDEHGGPTTSYNLVYAHALGLYYIFTGDEIALDSIRRTLDFHLMFTYPNGAHVETIDGRVPYRGILSRRSIPAFSLLPKGQRFNSWKFLLPMWGNQLSECSTEMASIVQYVRQGAEAAIPQDQGSYVLTMGPEAQVVKRDKWFYCFSAIDRRCPNKIAEPENNVNGKDRQQFVSLFHEDIGLIVGGGNSKYQPEFSDFSMEGTYLPDVGSAKLTVKGLALYYTHPRSPKPVRFELEADCEGDNATLTFRCPEPPVFQKVTSRLQLRIVPGKQITTAAGSSFATGGETIKLTAKQAGGWIAHNGWRVYLPAGVAFEYPVRMFDMRKRKFSGLNKAKGIVKAPFDAGTTERKFRFTIRNTK